MDTAHLPNKNTYQPFAHSQQRFTTASLIVLLMNSINSLCFFRPHFLTYALLFPIFHLFFSSLWLIHFAFVCPPSLCPLEQRLKMNCWLQDAPAMLRERRAVWWQITASDGLNCASFTWSPASFLFLFRSLSLYFLLAAFTHPLSLSQTETAFFPSSYFFVFPPSPSLLFQTWQRGVKRDGGRDW